MIVLGLNSHEINSSSAIVKNGKLIFGSTEERFIRTKNTKEFPLNSINFFLNKENLNIEDIDIVAQSWNPAAYYIKYNPLKSKYRTLREDYFYTIPDNILNVKSSHKRQIGNFVKMEFDIKNFPKIFYIQHHDCHAANAFYLSNFTKAAILICDFKGELESTSFHYGIGNKLKKLKSFNMPHSLGMFYATITQLLGYRPDQDEWKVMALSGMQSVEKSMMQKIKKLYELRPNGEVSFNPDFFRGNDLISPNLFSHKLSIFLGANTKIIEKKISDWHISIATAMQAASEEICFHYLKELYKITKEKNLCVGGGFFMNSVLNGKILENTPFENLYVPFAPTDAGNSIGAAMYANHHMKNKPRKKQIFFSQIGPSYNDAYILNVLKTRKVKFRNSKKIHAECASLISKHGFIGYFNGKSEFGDRALGNRSILGDPRKSETKDKINKAIKFREQFRPFAPVTKMSSAHLYFEVSKDFKNNYMEKVVKVKHRYAKKLEAVIHYDGSARIQTIENDGPDNLYNLLNEFEKISGFPILLNTSLNINGEPMVLSPEDALNTFYKSGLEVLVMNNYIVIK